MSPLFPGSYTQIVLNLNLNQMWYLPSVQLYPLMTTVLPTDAWTHVLPFSTHKTEVLGKANGDSSNPTSTTFWESISSQSLWLLSASVSEVSEDVKVFWTNPDQFHRDWMVVSSISTLQLHHVHSSKCYPLGLDSFHGFLLFSALLIHI